MISFKNVQTAAIAAALSISAIVPVAFAQQTTAGDGAADGAKHERKWGGRGHGRGHGGHRGGDMFGGVELTDAQKTQMRAIRENNKSAIEPLMTEIRAKKSELRNVNSQPTFDEALVRAKLTEIAALEAKAMGVRFKMHQETMAVLTAEQKATLEQKREQFKNRRAEWSEKRAAERAQ